MSDDERDPVWDIEPQTIQEVDFAPEVGCLFIVLIGLAVTVGTFIGLAK